MEHLRSSPKVFLSLAIFFCLFSFSFAQAQEFLVGGDISMLAKLEELGAVYKDRGRPMDLIDLFKQRGCNCLRLRLFVNPNYKNGVINDLPYTLELAKRIKQADIKLLLDFHYSDTWADPGHQHKPKAWESLDFEFLKRQVHDYTESVIAEFQKQDVLPEMVQIGNEIDPGFLWPDGKLDGEDPEKQWLQFTDLLKAGIAGARKPLQENRKLQIVIHTASGGNANKTRHFYDNLEKHGVEFDIIGLSYYPWWHGTMDDLRNNLQKTSERFKKDIFVVETAYPWRPSKRWKDKNNMEWPYSRKGQYTFLKELVQTVKQTPDQHGLGVLYWYPESIQVKGLHGWLGGDAALFNEKGDMLPGLLAFQQKESKKRPR